MKVALTDLKDVEKRFFGEFYITHAPSLPPPNAQ